MSRPKERYTLLTSTNNHDHDAYDDHHNGARNENGVTSVGGAATDASTFGTSQVFKSLTVARRFEKESCRREVELREHETTLHDLEDQTTRRVAPVVVKASWQLQRGDEEETAGANAGAGAGQLKDYLVSLLFFRKISVLLVFLPLGYMSHHQKWSSQCTFWFNFLGMIPLASILGEFTEELALHTNQTIGGLINATFGNAPEMVVAIQALQANEIRVVQASLLGSIFSNLLLVLGSCFFFGGLKYKEQSFNKTSATANMSLLALTSVGLVLPTPFAEYYEIHDEHVLLVSRIAAVFLLIMYLQLLLFQLKTHVDLFEDDDEEEANIPFWAAFSGLVIVALLVAIFSDYLVESIDGYVNESGVSRTFVGIVLLPIIGNAVEHMTAVSVAMKDKMDLSMGIAIGSSAQVSLFVVPFSTLMGWAMNKDMTLNFPKFEIILFILSIVIVSICLGNTKTNWLEGSLLITTYIMLGLGFWGENVITYRR
mmetsp:Transcript_27689/g.33687  ORF Transcript_27689/g.33687 Transcript_27689/m.33687 type:complete len:484 (+) Transcript_27689:230-1681(+)|eukprot:CAMPEP_0172505514 /NCGR_PEP_ID=MMETSP1066-20121228/187078_1 /TAXON_ID=671091 /ORGANISM="Coscinodiscus wailesii, Strain CCMP2513" /LENGTH=483 /DNA_ID=CAMNT_0013282147 /DNA_START=230 /DNA_END=1681 /DNA_ORIENTATION=-